MPPHFVDDSASIGPGTTLGHFTVIQERVQIGSGCQIGNNVVIRSGTRVGNDVRIDDGAVIGKQPMKAANSAVTGTAAQVPAIIGDFCLVGANAVIYAGVTIGRRVLIADLATIREEVQVGDFTIVGRGVAIENQCTIGRYCKLETNAYIAAYSNVEDRCFIAPGVLTSNDNYLGRTEERFKHFKGVTVRRGGRLGVGAVTLPGVEVGADGVVAAGGVLTRDADERTIYAGVPAEPFRSVPEEQLLDNQGWEDLDGE